jgi:hypothetical protein
MSVSSLQQTLHKSRDPIACVVLKRKQPQAQARGGLRKPTRFSRSTPARTHIV